MRLMASQDRNRTKPAKRLPQAAFSAFLRNRVEKQPRAEGGVNRFGPVHFSPRSLLGGYQRDLFLTRGGRYTIKASLKGLLV